MLEQALLLPTPVALRACLAFVVVLLTFGGGNLQLHKAPVVEIHHQRNKGHAVALGRGPKACNLAPFDQQFAFAALFMAEHGAVVRCDVGVCQPQFAVVDRGVAVGNVRLAKAQRFHFGPVQHDADFEIIFDRVVIARAPVLGDDFVILIFRFLCHGLLEIGDGCWRHKGCRSLDP